MARQTQHRAERDSARGRELSTLRKENQQLKRQVARLQRQIAKLEGEQAMYEAGVEAREELKKPKPRPEACDQQGCNGLLKAWKSPGGTKMSICISCKTRRIQIGA